MSRSQFENEINQAKKRVMEMNEKADKLSREIVKNEDENNIQPLINNSKDDNSFILILALIVLLSNEKADSKILIALLYLLM